MIKSVFVAALIASFACPARAADGDPAAGKDVFRKCQSCHKLGPDAKNSVGPVLTGVVGRPTGTAKDYNYSTLNHAAGEHGLVWTEDNIFNYLADPQGFLSGFLMSKGVSLADTGHTKMVFKLADEEQRRDVIAYLKTFQAMPAP